MRDAASGLALDEERLDDALRRFGVLRPICRMVWP
jgi:hypothetical protein